MGEEQGFVEAGGRLYFSASNGTTGREYYWVDASGAPAQLLADVAPGSDDSNPSELVELGNGLLVFVATNSQYGRELWVSDGTAVGTTLLADLTGPGEFSLIKMFFACGGALLFAFAAHVLEQYRRVLKREPRNRYARVPA